MSEAAKTEETPSIVSLPFRASVTKTAFLLALSGVQIHYLTVVRDRQNRVPGSSYANSRPGTDVFVPSVKTLISKGLVEHNPYWAVADFSDKPGEPPKDPSQDKTWVYRLTPAGEAVYTLRQIAGLVDA